MSRRRTAQSANLVACRSCGQISDGCNRAAEATLRCPLCHSKISSREEGMISKTWALVLTGFILYVPANLFPIMTVEILGSAKKETILSGVIELFSSGMWAIGLLVFCASITVPLAKLVGLSYLLISIQFGWVSRKEDRTRLYRLVEFIGRWSMLDVFLLSILVAVVNLGQVATISPDIGAVFFAFVVIITMFAAHIFDPRLIWDNSERKTSTL
ncbi:paraquat-inducible protein A [Rubellicoccus peritrichatus]|uniref:Paraquat-inducible protein A n=1 Tax=Rubellicoccus peritrichatus TaxID=3080537 RepID=A0AAQ3L9L4_9BACT|nr:paraquat-inducible protein A [Puniceicoccus sp. CR14]WOO42164.1 paraquat-inducible protein A [Puniceicoccus sp. CR14]